MTTRYSDPHRRTNKVTKISEHTSSFFRQREQALHDEAQEWFKGGWYSDEYGERIFWIWGLARLGEAVRDWLEIVKVYLEDSKMPPRIAKMLLEGKDEHGFRIIKTPGQNEAERKLRGGERLLLFVGLPGTGKSTAAAWILYSTLMKPTGKQAGLTWKTAQEIGGLARWDRDSIEKLARVRWLVIDDMGMEDELKGGRVEEVLIQRYDRGNVTLCTTNLKTHQLGAVDKGYDPRLIARFKEIGSSVTFHDVLRPDRTQPQKKPQPSQRGMF